MKQNCDQISIGERLLRGRGQPLMRIDRKAFRPGAEMHSCVMDQLDIRIENPGGI